ncbi:MAG: DUF3857 domain-containing protein [Paludibacter sp.]|nr:DUF3857 domain-containing protein [Paludibacter sp.]
MKIFRLLIISLIATGSLCAADFRPHLAVSLIPDSLKKNAYGVVRSATTMYEYKSESFGVQTESLTLTVLDKKGKKMTDFHYQGDKFRELKSFSVKLFDANGTFFRKFGMSDIKTTEWTDSYTLADDVKHYFLSCETPTFPFTAVFEYVIHWKNGILIFPSFFPQDNYHLSIEKAVYYIILPEKVEYKYKCFNLPENPLKTNKKGLISSEWKVENLKAIESEILSPNLQNLAPLLYIRPVHFSFDNVKGTVSDWQTLGLWEYGLVQGRDLLSDATKVKIKELTRDAKTDREKVKILYDYLGERTRYVSIQLGIGGFQPILASEVCKTGFGDCKALSNYLKAMLTAVGINSYFAVIKSDKTIKSFYPDYASMNQMNHAILQVPLPNDTLWLECTNPRVPFGFVHNNISGHDALVITPEGGKVQKLPDYPDSLNIESFSARIVVNEDGSAKANTIKTCKVKIYDNNNQFTLKKPSEQTDDLREDITLPSVIIGNIVSNEDKCALPGLTINYSWTTPLYGTKTGNRLFVPVNPFRTTYKGLKKSKRLHDIVIHTGYVDSDSISIVLPDGYEIETIPPQTKIESVFGYFISEVKIVGKTAEVHQKIYLKSGSWDTSTYNDFVNFIEKISTAYKEKIIIRKI